MTDSLRILFLILDAAAEVCLEGFKDVIVLTGNMTRWTSWTAESVMKQIAWKKTNVLAFVHKWFSHSQPLSHVDFDVLLIRLGLTTHINK